MNNIKEFNFCQCVPEIQGGAEKTYQKKIIENFSIFEENYRQTYLRISINPKLDILQKIKQTQITQMKKKKKDKDGFRLCI